MTTVTHIWFRTSMRLSMVAEHLGLPFGAHDCEDTWEWIIGDFERVSVDLYRDHTQSRWLVDCILFRLDRQPFDEVLKSAIVQRLQTFISKPIHCGCWEGQQGNPSQSIIVEKHPGKIRRSE